MSRTVYSIHPAIGVGRVGNAPEEFYIGPETEAGLPIMPDGSPFTPAAFRDSQGRVRRQAARFRIYRSTDGSPPEEVTLDTAGVLEIYWRAHLANKKSSWYEFQTTKGEFGYASNHPLRNPDKKTTQEREALIIDPGPRSISGRDKRGVEFSRKTIPRDYKGSFPPPKLKPDSIDTLGELRTDSQGRLLVLGGLGHAGSDIDPPSIADYANNNGWWDDTSDGSIEAIVVVREGNGTPVKIPVEPAWFLCGPPGYAPQIPNVVTLYDTMFDTAVRYMGARPDIFEDELWKGGPDGYKPYFETDIKPIFEHVNLNSWVTAIPPKPHTFDFERMAKPGDELIGYRTFFLDFIRAPGQENTLIDPERGVIIMPYLAGDEPLGVSTAIDKYLRVSDTQYFMLTQWANGWFHPGAEPQPNPGQALTRAVLENCVGGAFVPGIEITWISRNPRIYMAPFRIKPRPVARAPLSLGFDPSKGMEPGDLTRYMAVPWQADFNECTSQPVGDRTVWWWPAQRPLFVYLPPEAKRAGGPYEGLGPQVAWVGQIFDQNAIGYLAFRDDLEMVALWDQLGFVHNIGTAEEPHFVEVERRLPRNP